MNDDTGQPIEDDDALEALRKLRDEAAAIGDIHNDDQDEP